MSTSATSNLKIRNKVPLTSFTTMQIGGPAAYFAEPTNQEELVEAVTWAQSQNLPLHILGKGSNTIFDDEGYDGLILLTTQFQKEFIEVDEESKTVRVSSGVHLYRFARFCRDRGLAGGEFLVNIPGTVGGALIMNAGFSRHAGQKNEIGDLVVEVTVLTTEGKIKTLRKDDLEFSYRKSNLKPYVILEAKLKFWKRSSDLIAEEMQTNYNTRNDLQDLRYPSSGSIFKNPEPPASPAAKMIDELGLKGRQVGGIQISEKHANYFINRGGGKCSDVRQLIQEVQEQVFNAKGISLQPELTIISKN